MRSRIAFLLAAVLTALVACVVVPLHLTWAPESPLEFSYLGSRPPMFQFRGAPASPFARTFLDFEVRNKSNASIHLKALRISRWQPGSPPKMVDHLDASALLYPPADAPSTAAYTDLVIPPRATIRCSLSTMLTRVPEFERSLVKADYTWISSTKVRTARFMDRHRKYLPEPCLNWLPFVGLHCDVAPLDSAPPLKGNMLSPTSPLRTTSSSP